MKRPIGVIIVAILMFIGAGLLGVGTLAFFELGPVAMTAGAEGPMSRLFSDMGTIGAAIFVVLAVAYLILAIEMFRLVYWARLASIVSIALGVFFAVFGIFVSFPRPDMLVFGLQLFVIAVDIWMLAYLMRPHVRELFTAQRHDPRRHAEARA